MASKWRQKIDTCTEFRCRDDLFKRRARCSCLEGASGNLPPHQCGYGGLQNMPLERAARGDSGASDLTEGCDSCKRDSRACAGGCLVQNRQDISYTVSNNLGMMGSCLPQGGQGAVMLHPVFAEAHVHERGQRMRNSLCGRRERPEILKRHILNAAQALPPAAVRPTRRAAGPTGSSVGCRV